MRVALYITLASTLLSCQDATLNIKQIANKTPQQVQEILGEADTSYTQMIVTKPIFTQIFRDEFEIEIMYPDGLATDIVILDAAPELPYDENVISRFGLKNLPPSHVMKNAYIKWKNYPGFTTINIFATDLDSSGNVEQFRLFFKSDGKMN